MALIWSPRAQRRLAEYARNLAAYDYPETAVNWLLEIKSSAEHLADFHEAGRESPEFKGKRPQIRDITIGNYRLFYRIKKGNVEIVSIHNCKQAITSLRSL